MRLSWKECFGSRPYLRNWLRHTAATYAAAVFGRDIAAKLLAPKGNTGKRLSPKEREKQRKLREKEERKRRREERGDQRPPLSCPEGRAYRRPCPEDRV